MPTRKTEVHSKLERVPQGSTRVRWLLSAVGRRAGDVEALPVQLALVWIRAGLIEPIGTDKAKIVKHASRWKESGPIVWSVLPPALGAELRPVRETPRRRLPRERHEYWEEEFRWRNDTLKRGNFGALYDALCLAAERDQERFDADWCFPKRFKGRVKNPLSEDHWIEIPRWVWYATAHITAHWLRSHSTSTGQTALWLKRRRQDMIDRGRWELVKQLHQEGRTFHASRKQLNTIFELAAQRLKGTAYAGAADTVERSYDKVERNLKSDSGRYRELPRIRPQSRVERRS